MPRPRPGAPRRRALASARDGGERRSSLGSLFPSDGSPLDGGGARCSALEEGSDFPPPTMPLPATAGKGKQASAPSFRPTILPSTAAVLFAQRWNKGRIFPPPTMPLPATAGKGSRALAPFRAEQKEAHRSYTSAEDCFPNDRSGVRVAAGHGSRGPNLSSRLAKWPTHVASKLREWD